MSNRKRTIPTASTQQTDSARRALLEARQGIVDSTESLKSVLLALHGEILRGSFPGFNGGVAR